MTRKEVLQDAVEKCYQKMYACAQPEISWDEIKRTVKPDDQFYKRYYLSMDDYKDIVDEFESAYNIKDKWYEHADLIIDYLQEGGYQEKYDYGKRYFEKTKPLDEFIGKDNADKCIDLIKRCKSFYKPDYDSTSFRLTCMNYSPNSNKEDVEKYWKEHGVELHLKDNILNDEE